VAQGEPNLTIRPLRPGEEAAVIALVERVFDETVAPHYSDAGVREFYSYAAAEPLAARSLSNHFVLVAEQGDALVGMIEMRHAQHVAMLFVEPRGRGIGGQLLKAALAVCESEHPDLARVTVHSSPNAVAAYEKLGFLATDQEGELNGIRFIPMALEIGQ
jgi:GNAT superfamily N-acetyltransferase